jgi:hypothetical protein
MTAPPTREHLAQIAAAKTLGRKIRRAVTYATIDGWTIAVFGALTALTSLFSALGLGLGAGMIIVAWFEFRGAAALKRLDLNAPKRLAINQIALGGLLFLYAAISLGTSLTQPSAISAEIGNDPQLNSMLGPIDDLTRTIYIAVYATLMAVAILGPGMNAVYYLTRRSHIQTYLRETPTWILDLQRAGMSL